MSEPPIDAAATSEQSPGTDPRSKRNSGLFAFFKWFKPGSRESIVADDSSRSSSLESVASDKSSGTVASFRFVSPTVYENKVVLEKQVPIGPETDTYRARLKQRDKRRETDKNVTLRKKYNLFFNRETLLRPQKLLEEDENSKSLPLMTRAHIMEVEPQKVHRRTNSESSKVRRAGAYLHVKGKRKAPQPPGGNKLPPDPSSTNSLKRKKRVAPAPPPKVEITENLEEDVLANDYLKLDHGVLKPVKEDNRPKTPQENLQAQNMYALSPSSSRGSFVEAPVSPRPWYKRNSTSKEMLVKKENKYEPIERLPDVQYMRNSTLDLTLEDSRPNPKDEKKKEDKRKSGLSFLTNISELDREASEIIKNKAEYERIIKINNEIPEFMKPKEIKTNIPSTTTDSWASPKRRSARDLIAKFNAITNVTKVSVFGASQKDKYFGKQTSLDETKQRQLLESHKKRIEDIDKKKEDRFSPLMKSESASAVKLSTKESTPKMERKSWTCPKCNLENEYWRIICHVCSAIKPYFDDFSSSGKTNINDSKGSEPTKTSSPLVLKKDPLVQNNLFERSKTQIGFSALATYNANNKLKSETAKSNPESKVDDTSKKEERDRLKKMLIEMKNSLPKRKSNILMKQNSRSSIIMENPYDDINKEVKEIPQENKQEEEEQEDKPMEKTQAEKVAEILIGTQQTIYENIKVRKTENPKPLKVSSSAQTSAVMKKLVPESSLKKLIENHKVNNAYEPMKVQDFEDIYSDKNGKNAAKLYANLAQNDELSLFFNVPKCNSETKLGDINGESKKNINTDTIEINRLLRRLENAIGKGELTEAAIFAKELAQLKVNCSVIRQKAQGHTGGKHQGFQIDMYVEDKVSHRGPFSIDVTESQTVAELKQQIAVEFEIPVEVQRWILGKELVVDDKSTLKDHKITEGCPVFLYLVAPEKKPREFQTKKSSSVAQPSTSTAKQDSSTIINPVANKNEQTKHANALTEKNDDRETKKNKIEAPKIVNVIPKSSDVAKPEVVRIVPIHRGITNEKPESGMKRASTVTEIKVDIKPYSSRYSKNDIKEEKTGLVRATATKIEVFQAPPVKIANVTSNQEQPKRASIQQNYSQKSANTQTVTAEVKEANISPHSSASNNESSTRIYPNLSNLSTTSSFTQVAPKEEYDTNTLRPPKEWECHLCTLLNPDSSNICAICATVRIKKTSLRRSNKKKPAPQPQKDQTYLQLVNLDSADLVANADVFECLVCFLEVAKGDGVTLRECLHQFCKDCLARTVEFSDDAEIKCPFRDEEYSCNIAIQDREIKAIVSPDVYEQHLAKSMAQAENRMEKTFHCKTPDCKGWCIFEDNVNEFRCPVCRKMNCLTCQAIHMGANCKQYQERMKDESNMNEDARRTKDFLEEMVEKGEAIACPTCKVILMKKWGCDWLRCSMCKTEICWVTRGPRWGPGGKGDTSGGCQCGLNGVKCHPKCNYCH